MDIEETILFEMVHSNHKKLLKLLAKASFLRTEEERYMLVAKIFVFLYSLNDTVRKTLCDATNFDDTHHFWVRLVLEGDARIITVAEVVNFNA